MARGKKTDALVDKVLETDQVIVFQAKEPLTEQQHLQLAAKVRAEQKKTGVKIVLAPHIVEVKLDEPTSNE